MTREDPDRQTGGRASPSSGEQRVMMAVEQALKESHRRAATRPIAGPDEHGAFPSAWRPGPFGRGVPPVVVDANVLRNDVRYACENECRTVLVTAANSGAIRLFAASHVIEELAEHGEHWALESDQVSPAEFEARWRSEYLPLIRVVDDRDLPRTLLGPAEAERVRSLDRVDPDDVPSVTLALTIGAFYLSEDGPALRAVYGESVDRDAHHAWLDRLMAGGDASQLGKMIFAAGALPALAGAGILSGARWIAERFSPWALTGIGIGLAVLLLTKPPTAATRQKATEALVELGAYAVYAYARYQDAYADFARMSPAVPGWEELTASNRAEDVLARLSMHELARTPGGLMSADELASALPRIDVDETLVAGVLRRVGCFSGPYTGRWQLGATGSRAATDRAFVMTQDVHPVAILGDRLAQPGAISS